MNGRNLQQTAKRSAVKQKLLQVRWQPPKVLQHRCLVTPHSPGSIPSLQGKHWDQLLVNQERRTAQKKNHTYREVLPLTDMAGI